MNDSWTVKPFLYPAVVEHLTRRPPRQPRRCRIGWHSWSRWSCDEPGLAARICQREHCATVEVRPTE